MGRLKEEKREREENDGVGQAGNISRKEEEGGGLSTTPFRDTHSSPFPPSTPPVDIHAHLQVNQLSPLLTVCSHAYPPYALSNARVLPRWLGARFCTFRSVEFGRYPFPPPPPNPPETTTTCMSSSQCCVLLGG